MIETWVWTILSFLGLCISVYRVISSNREKTGMGEAGMNGVALAVVSNRLRAQALRTISFTFQFLVGVISLLEISARWVRPTVIWMLIGSVGLLMLNSALDETGDRRVMNLYNKESKN